MTSLKLQQNFSPKDDRIWQVIVGNMQQPVCIPRNLATMVQGSTMKLPYKIACLVEQVKHYNLSLTIVVNRSIASPKPRAIPVILVNANRQNVWIRQPLSATEFI